MARAQRWARILLPSRRVLGKHAFANVSQTLRSRVRTPHKHIPAYLHPDVQRAARLGIRTNYHPTRSQMYAVIKESPFEKNALIVGGRKDRWDRSTQRGSWKAGVLSGVRHEIGHHEVERSPQDQRRLRIAGRKYGHGRSHTAFRERDEMLAWKNAIRASPHGNIKWASVESGLQSYHGKNTRRKGRVTGWRVNRRYPKAAQTLQRYQRFVRHVRRKK